MFYFEQKQRYAKETEEDVIECGPCEIYKQKK